MEYCDKLSYIALYLFIGSFVMYFVFDKSLILIDKLFNLYKGDNNDNR